jgi:hypothetical protein
MRSLKSAQRRASQAGNNRFPALEQPEMQGSDMFAQILGKFYFFNLRENLRHILFDYEEKRSCTTNGAFKSAC